MRALNSILNLWKRLRNGEISVENNVLRFFRGKIGLKNENVIPNIFSEYFQNLNSERKKANSTGGVNFDFGGVIYPPPPGKGGRVNPKIFTPLEKRKKTLAQTTITMRSRMVIFVSRNTQLVLQIPFWIFEIGFDMPPLRP